jgi:hypothetical protein
MLQSTPKSVDAEQRQKALGGWDDEGGAGPCGPLAAVRSLGDDLPLPEMGKAEMLALHIRVIALENLLIALLATASDEQRHGLLHRAAGRRDPSSADDASFGAHDCFARAGWPVRSQTRERRTVLSQPRIFAHPTGRRWLSRQPSVSRGSIS